MLLLLTLNLAAALAMVTASLLSIKSGRFLSFSVAGLFSLATVFLVRAWGFESGLLLAPMLYGAIATAAVLARALKQDNANKGVSH